MAQSVTVLGIHDGHNSSACLMRDGRLVAAVSEERLTRFKNEAGYPRRAVEECFQLAGCDPSDVDAVALGSRFMHAREFFQNWDWYKKGRAEQREEREGEPKRRAYFLEERTKERVEAIVKHLDISREKVHIVEHHTAHAATAYYGSAWSLEDESVLVLTLDGSGDGLCCTVSVGRNGVLRRIAATPSHASLGKVYSRLTFLMGMTPWEHEYKIMGLAPYADEKGVSKALEVIRPLVRLAEDGLTFEPGTDVGTNYCYPYLRAELENHRFDWIAGAVQQFTEQLMVDWVRSVIAHTGIGKVVCAGGVFMNVKANMLVAELCDLDNIFVFPSCGDESICMGAAYTIHRKIASGNGCPVATAPICTAYLGTSYSSEEVERVIREGGAHDRYLVRRFDDVDRVVGDLLASGEIVARFSGRMEWGARALGNRSILADPRDQGLVAKLNSAIKERDFWMPFAPTVLASRQHDYLHNEKNLASPHMLLGFRTTSEGQASLGAAMQPCDSTSRPQLLDEEANPGYHSVIKRFEESTGVGAVLNTSFNLHGDPIVRSPEDAIETFDRSGLTHLAMEDWVLTKNGVLPS